MEEDRKDGLGGRWGLSGFGVFVGRREWNSGWRGKEGRKVECWRRRVGRMDLVEGRWGL